MSTSHIATVRTDQPADSQPSDDFLITSMRGGDQAALSKLMDRYDRLVRYAVFHASRDRCAQDPQWLDAMASATWEGFVRSMRRAPDGPPSAPAAYLVRIARNKVASSLRRPVAAKSLISFQDADAHLLEDPGEEPVETVERLELLESLRGCLAELEAKDRTLAGQLPAIAERRWRDAAEALGIRESTLRSRWKRVLERLRACIGRKTGESFAPGSPLDD